MDKIETNVGHQMHLEPDGNVRISILFDGWAFDYINMKEDDI